jgi:hypothetical protein
MREGFVKISHDVGRYIGALFIRLHNNLYYMDKSNVYPHELVAGARDVKERAFTNFLERYEAGDPEYLYYDIGLYDEIMDDLCLIRNAFIQYCDDDSVVDMFSIIDSIAASFKDNERRFM